MKNAVPNIAKFMGGAASLLVGQKLFGNNKDVGGSGGGSGDEFKYVDGCIEIPDEMYNKNEKYNPNNSGLSNYGGNQYNHEYHLKWSQNNCWVLANLYLYFRPELKSTYEEYASKSIKEIINDLDNLDKDNMRHMNHIFANGHQNFLDDLKQSIKNSNFDSIFNYFNTSFVGIDEEKKQIWDRIPNKNKADALISFYNYQTLYRFHYALSLKNRCRIYTKMINNPNKMVNIYEMDDLCKEGDLIPSWWLSGKGVYEKIFKILGQKYKEVNYVIDLRNLSSTLEYTNSYIARSDGSASSDVSSLYNLHNDKCFDFKPENNQSVWDFSCFPFSNGENSITENMKESQKTNPKSVDFAISNEEARNNAIDKFLKNGIKYNGDGSKSYVTSIRIEKSNHTQIIRLKYDDNLKCTHLVDKQCYQDDDKIVSVPNEYENRLFEFIFKHMNSLGFYGIFQVHFIKENELRNNLNYYKL